MARLNEVNVSFKQHSPSLHSPIAAMADPCKYVANRASDTNLPKNSRFFVASPAGFSCYSRDWLPQENTPCLAPPCPSLGPFVTWELTPRSI